MHDMMHTLLSTDLVLVRTKRSTDMSVTSLKNAYRRKYLKTSMTRNESKSKEYNAYKTGLDQGGNLTGCDGKNAGVTNDVMMALFH